MIPCRARTVNTSPTLPNNFRLFLLVFACICLFHWLFVLLSFAMCKLNAYLCGVVGEKSGNERALGLLYLKIAKLTNNEKKTYYALMSYILIRYTGKARLYGLFSLGVWRCLKYLNLYSPRFFYAVK